MKKETKIFSLRLPVELREKIEKKANKERRSLSNFIIKTLEEVCR